MSAIKRESPTGGVKPMPLAGRLQSARERLAGMTETERKWRRQWLLDQKLAPNEPVVPPGWYEATHNPIRRFYRAPLNAVASALTPVLGAERAQFYRYVTGKALIGVAAVYWFAYYFKYNANNWTTKAGWKVTVSRKDVVPGDPNFPQPSDRTKPSDYGSRGFKDCNLNL